MRVNSTLPAKRTTEERFWSHVNKTETCWLWTASTNDYGYGQFGVTPHRIVRAHRFSYELANGPIPAGMYVLHRCDNPPCIRPGHLFHGDARANAIDRASKKRGNPPKGQAQHLAKLTEQGVQLIRTADRGELKVSELSQLLGVSTRTIYEVLWRKTWKHVP